NAPAGIEAELVVGEARSAGSRTKELACLQRAVADEIVGHAVECVTATLRHHVNPRRSMAVGGVHEVGHDLKFRYGVERQGNRRIVLVDDTEIHAVQIRAGRSVTHTADLDGAFVHDTGSAGGFQGARSQSGKVKEVSRIERQLQHGAV